MEQLHRAGRSGRSRGVSWTDLLRIRRLYVCASIVGGSRNLARIFNSFSILKVTK
jgi:hypothetical protein